MMSTLDSAKNSENCTSGCSPLGRPPPLCHPARSCLPARPGLVPVPASLSISILHSTIPTLIHWPLRPCITHYQYTDNHSCFLGASGGVTGGEKTTTDEGGSHGRRSGRGPQLPLPVARDEWLDVWLGGWRKVLSPVPPGLTGTKIARESSSLSKRARGGCAEPSL